jgi:hypothetical protein
MKLVLAFSLSRVFEHYQRKQFCIVSGYLSDSKPEVNLDRTKALKQAIRSRGYGFVEMEGHWVQTRGSNKGEDVVERSLFIPNCSYEDATYFGSGQYYTPEPRAQEAVVFADQNKLMLLGSTPGGKWAPMQEFDRVLANMEPLLKKWYQRRTELSKIQQEEKGQKLTEEEIKERDALLPEENDYMGWSVLNPKHKPQAWKFSAVTLNMIEPPEVVPGSQGSAMKAAYWNDKKCYEFYQPAAPSGQPDRGGAGLLYRGALYVRVDGPRTKLPKQVVALLRRKFRVPSFASEIDIPEKNAQHWDIDPKNILDSTVKYSSGDLPTRFSWHPTSGEFLLSSPAEMHADTIRTYGSHPFDEYVRGLVLRDLKTIATRPWAPNVDFGMSTGDPEEDRAQQFMVEQASAESQAACKRVLTTLGGVPASWKWRFDVANADLQDMTGIFRW